MSLVVKKVSELESALLELTRVHTQFQREMVDFKDEMLEFKNEMSDFKDEMTDFKAEMKQFKIDSEKDRKQMNKQWGELANKMGTIVEDLISPAIRPLIKKYFNIEVSYFATRVRKKVGDLMREYDVVAIGCDMVFIVEEKTSPTKKYIDEFLCNIEIYKKLFPEHSDKKIVPMYGSFKLDEGIIELLSEHNIYALAYREWDFMDILNFDMVKM